MRKLYSAARGLFVVTLVVSAAQADGPGISAQRLLSSWKGEDSGMRMVAEVIASAFASGLSWKGSLGGKEVYCPPPGLKGGQVMTALEQFLASNPDLAERSYGDAMAMSLSKAFPCQTRYVALPTKRSS
jgi:Ssp1 endopeptidase immunity protein Rap1a